MNITIHTPNGLYYGVYSDSGVWTQADNDNPPTHFAVLDTEPTVAGIYSGAVYEEEDEVESALTDADFTVSFEGVLDGEFSAVLTTDSDATEEIDIEVDAECSIENNHGRAMARRLPTGMALQGDSVKAPLKGIGTECRRIELDFNNKAKVSEILFGENIQNWLTCLNLKPVSEPESAITRKLTDKSGITPADITNALHTAGFTELYCYPNKFYIYQQGTQCGDAECGDDECSPKKTFTSIDPSQYENLMPFYSVGSECGEAECGQYFKADLECGDAECGDEISKITDGADLLVDDLDYDGDKWGDIPENEAEWFKAFIISGDPIMTIVDIPEAERKELRKLLIERKPFKSYGLLFINYSRS